MPLIDKKISHYIFILKKKKRWAQESKTNGGKKWRTMREREREREREVTNEKKNEK